jgi:3-methyladenine DNA glycosylase AlkD
MNRNNPPSQLSPVSERLTKTLIQEITEELKQHADSEVKRKSISYEKLYQEEPKLHGTPSSTVREISAKHFLRVKRKTEKEILQLCEELLNAGYTEERTVAFDWAFRVKRQYEESDFHIFESWLKKHVHNWGACDDLCTHGFGAFIFQFPEFISNVKAWTQSTNRWIKRACAVVMIYSVRRQKHLKEILEIADILLMDSDVMVQKGYGWMLKEASNRYPKEVFDYVMKHRKEMPRTSLRYAIEKLPPELKREAMKKETH